MSLREEVETKQELSGKVRAWLDDYEIPESIYGVISALMSLGYLSGKLTKRAADGAVLCPHGKFSPDVCSECGESSIPPRR